MNRQVHANDKTLHIQKYSTTYPKNIERFGTKLVPSPAKESKYTCWVYSTDYGNRLKLVKQDLIRIMDLPQISFLHHA